MNLFGGKKGTNKYRVVPRAPGDTAPLDPMVVVVVFDGPDDPNVAAADVHQELAKRVADLGPEDRGFTHLTMSLTKKTV